VTVTVVPLVDLRWQHCEIESELLPRLVDLMRTGQFVLGQPVARFEEEFAAFCGVRFCRGVANGTDAIELALRAGGIGAGDEVVVPANTFIASASAILRTGATPRLIDCDPVHQLLDPEQLEAVSSPRTRAVLAVHLFGQLAPMTRIATVAESLHLRVFEDAAQSQGASQGSLGMGRFGVATATSFYPGKNLGAYGDGGAVLTDDHRCAAAVSQLRDHGSTSKYRHERVGMNSRLDALQALVLRAKLAHLPEWNRLRQGAAARYQQLLADVPGVALPAVMAGNIHVWHLYVVRVQGRDRIAELMQADGIGVGKHYPLPLHLQPALAFLGYRPGDFPEAERASEEVLSLPLYPGIEAAAQERVVDALRAALSRAGT